jgi:hypothetical protein
VNVRDSYDKALAETITGLFKAEVIRRRASGKIRKSWSTGPSNVFIGSNANGCLSRSAPFLLRSSRKHIMINRYV